MKEYNITDFGAVGNGNSDCTAAIQKALDTAGERTEGGAVLVPPGIYQTGPLRIPSHVALRGIPSWGYKTVGGSILRWRGKETANDKALLDITGSVGCRISGLCLEGSGSQGEIHGISFARQDFFDHPEEDAFIVEDCQIHGFSGCGLFLQYACCFSVRHCHIFENASDGVYINSWDGFFLDNQISSNMGWGVHCASMGVNNSAFTFTGNRIEWNRKGGIYLRHSRLWNITGNCFDRSGGPAIYIDRSLSHEEVGDNRWVSLPCQAITITGNVFNRSGADFFDNLAQEDSCHIRLCECFGVTVTGNTFLLGQDDVIGEGKYSPKHGVVFDKLKGCVIANNALWKACLEEPILWALDASDGNVVIQGNVGCPVPRQDLESGHFSWEN